MKARSDSKLKHLPKARQEQIYDWCETPKSADCVGGLEFAKEQLASDGLSVGVRALCEFRKWYLDGLFYEGAVDRSEQQKALMLDFDPSNVDRAEAFGDYCFLQESLAARDAKTYATVRSVRLTNKALDLKSKGDSVKAKQKDRQLSQKDKEITLALRRLELLEAKCQSASATLADGALSPEQREARMKEIFGVA